MSHWQDKVVLITGGSSGLGLEIAREFARAHAKVCLIARNENRLKDAQSQLHQQQLNADIYCCDVQSDEEVQNVFDKIVAEQGQIDVLVNNVGKSTRVSLIDATVEQYNDMMQVNFHTMVRCTNKALAEIVKRRGHIVNIGSLAAKTAWPFMATYTASKHAVAVYTHQHRIEGPEEVHFMLVCPGPIQRDDSGQRYNDVATDLPDQAKQTGAGAKVKSLCPQKLARKIVTGCERRRAEIIMPAKSRLLFIASAISTRLGDWLIRKFCKK